MILLPNFDIPSGFQLEKILQEFPFQGPVFFDLGYQIQYLFLLFTFVGTETREIKFCHFFFWIKIALK